MPPLIPYKTYTIETSLTLDEAVRLVAAAIAPPRSLFQGWGKAAKDFEGTVSASGFSISRAIRYRNSFLPYLYGTFVNSPQGVRVKVQMMLHPLVIGFAVLWCGIAGSFLLVPLAGSLSTGRFDELIFLPAGMLIFFYLMVFVGFGIEAGKAERFLQNLFEFHRRF